MKLWVDDVRPVPNGFWWCRSVNEAIRYIEQSERAVRKYIEAGDRYFTKRDYDGRNRCYNKANEWSIDLIDIDHDAGEFASDGGDYIKLLDWLERTGRNYPIRIHSMNPVGVENMRRIIHRNGWREVYG